jgi:RNA recognition motif-containing protein
LPKPCKTEVFEMTDQGRLKGTIYVGGLASMVDSANLHAAFIPFGEIVDVSLPKPESPSSTELHRGFGYIEFEDPADAAEAVDNMDQSELFGRVIKVSAAKPQKNANEGLGSKTAVWEQVKKNSIANCPSFWSCSDNYKGDMACRTRHQRRR